MYPLYTQGRMLLSLGQSTLTPTPRYGTERDLTRGAGVTPGYDLTHEAAFAKLLWLASRKDLSFSQRQRIFQSPVCGEMTVGNGPGQLVPRAE